MFFVEKLSLGLLFFPPHPSLGKIHKNIILGLFVISILEKSLGNMKIAFLVNESWILYWYIVQEVDTREQEREVFSLYTCWENG